MSTASILATCRPSGRTGLWSLAPRPPHGRAIPSPNLTNVCVEAVRTSGLVAEYVRASQPVSRSLKDRNTIAVHLCHLKDDSREPSIIVVEALTSDPKLDPGDCTTSIRGN